MAPVAVHRDAESLIDEANHLSLLDQVELSVNALSNGDFGCAYDGLLATSRQLAASARWLQGDWQRRYLDLSDRFLQQALQLEVSASAVSFAPQVRAPSLVAAALPCMHGCEPTSASVPSNSMPARDATHDVPASSSTLAVTAVMPALQVDGGPSGLHEVVGASAVKQLLLANFVHPLRHPAQAALYRQRGACGALLYGTPGTGKTYLVRALAADLGVPVFIVSPADILSKWFGEAEKQLADLFAQARKHPAALIFIDEIDALAPHRDSLGDNSGPLQRLLTQLLTELDGFASGGGCLMFVGATNRPWALDDALLRPGRLDVIAYLGRPDAATRQLLLEHTLQGIPQAHDIDWELTVRALKGCSAAETVACARRAASRAFEDAVCSGHNRPVCTEDLITAASQGQRAATPEMLARLAAFAQARGLPPPEDGEDDLAATSNDTVEDPLIKFV